MNSTEILRLIERLRAIGQIGLTYGENQYDLDRYATLKTISEELLTVVSGFDSVAIAKAIGEEKGYTTPKVDVRGMVFRDDTVLLVKERSDSRWTVPGGWADVGDSPAEAVTREIREESGFESIVKKLLAVYDRDKQDHPPMAYHVYKIFFLCEITGGEAKASLETESVAFFPVHKLPELSVPRVNQRQILRFYEHYRNPAMPSEWD
jgi:ADP-ribose pyrophosphatase YjhB (NUDIX family)